MSENVRTVFVSGANRGIGLELVRQLAKQGYKVFAGYRDKKQSEELLDEAAQAGNLFPFQVDVTVESEIEELYGFISTQAGYLDVLINNAAVNLKRSAKLNELDWSDMADHLQVNVGGVFLTTKYLYPLLKTGKSKKVINLSSNLGSIELSGGGSIAYRVSKAGLNMLTKQQAVEYRADGIVVISLSPGWVKTDMGGASAPMSAQEAVSRILGIMDTVSLGQSGQFIGIDGGLLPY